MSVDFAIDTRNFERAASQLAIRKGKSDADVVNKAMKYLLPFAAARVKAKTPKSGTIRKELTGRAARISRGRKKMRDALANTLAAAIIAKRMKKRGHVLPSRKDADKIDMARINDFYVLVRIFANARIRSANYLRAGFIPAYRAFGVPGMVPGKKYRGNSKGIKAVPSLTKTVEAYATNQRSGAYKIAPNAFRYALRDVTSLFMKWLAEDTVNQAKKSGFF